MVKALRHIRIKELLSEKGAIDVQTLSRELDTSAVTIRNDLIHLEQEGFLVRTYGGAVLCGSQAIAPVAARPASSENLEEAAQLAAQYVKPSTWIMLGFGSTCRAMARHLLNMDIGIVTGNLDAVMILSASQKAQILLPGGYLSKKNDYLFTSGEWYQKSLSSFAVDQAYISVAGIDPSGFTLDSASECSTLELLRTISKEMVLVSDSSKFDRTSFFRIGDFSFVDTIISDDGTPEAYHNICRESGVRLITPSRVIDR